uniref:PLD phosphodiesterase domain-containing protein n=1 Tax=Acrobeloides nanus TaxID=290746 RepID=A0A914C1F1_9BILA
MIPIGTTSDGRADMTNFEMDLFDTRMSGYKHLSKEESEECCKNSIIKPACIPITIISFFIIMIIFFPLFSDDALESAKNYEKEKLCKESCKFRFVESIPVGMKYENLTNSSTYNAWKQLLSRAQNSVDLAVLYWNLNETGYNTSWQGNEIFHLISNLSSNGVKVRVAQNYPSAQFPQKESQYLQEHNLADVRSLNFAQLYPHTKGSGVLHTKFWIIDDKHVYIGSANMDWKSLTEVKELGVLIEDCSCLAVDLSKIFAVYWKLGEEEAKIPDKWPISWRTSYNAKDPLDLTLNNNISSGIYISSSPKEFNPKGREHDLDAIINVMETANEFIHISVMDYIPSTLYYSKNSNFFWPKLDDAIRAAAYRGVQVQMLISHWEHSKKEMIPFLKSLLEINGAIKGKIQVKLFTVPKGQEDIPFSRVNHAKYMVTENTAYVGTSNWAGDYFIRTAGVGVIVKAVNDRVVIEQLQNIFNRDWNSPYASSELDYYLWNAKFEKVE